MDSEFHALDSGFFVSEIWIPDSNRKRDSGFLKLSSRFQSPGFRMPQAKIPRGFRSTNPFHGARTSYASWTPGGGGALKESLGRAVISHLGFGFVKGTAWHHHLTNVEKTCSRCHSQ